MKNYPTLVLWGSSIATGGTLTPKLLYHILDGLPFRYLSKTSLYYSLFDPPLYPPHTHIFVVSIEFYNANCQVLGSYAFMADETD